MKQNEDWNREKRHQTATRGKGSQRKKRKRSTNKRIDPIQSEKLSVKNEIIVVDGNNVANACKDEEDRPRLQNIIQMKKVLEGFHCKDVIIIVSAALRYEIDDPETLIKLIKNKIINEVPGGSYDDVFIINSAKKFNALIVSNDRFRDFPEFDWIRKRQIPFMFIREEIIFYNVQT